MFLVLYILKLQTCLCYWPPVSTPHSHLFLLYISLCSPPLLVPVSFTSLRVPPASYLTADIFSLFVPVSASGCVCAPWPSGALTLCNHHHLRCQPASTITDADRKCSGGAGRTAARKPRHRSLCGVLSQQREAECVWPLWRRHSRISSYILYISCLKYFGYISYYLLFYLIFALGLWMGFNKYNFKDEDNKPDQYYWSCRLLWALRSFKPSFLHEITLYEQRKSTERCREALFSFYTGRAITFSTELLLSQHLVMRLSHYYSGAI